VKREFQEVVERVTAAGTLAIGMETGRAGMIFPRVNDGPNPTGYRHGKRGRIKKKFSSDKAVLGTIWGPSELLFYFEELRGKWRL
jgi:hypothetical protein